MLVTPDAVVGLVECAAQARARVGEREALAAPLVTGLDRENAHAVLVVAARVAEQAHRIGLRRQREQQVAGVTQPPGFGGRGPGAVAARRREACARRFAPLRLRGFVGLFALPGEHRARERELLERLAEPGFDLAQRRVGVETGQFARGQLRRFAPHEPGLHLVERVEVVVALAQRGQRVADAEERADEGVDVRTQFDQQRGLGARVGWRAPRVDQPLREPGIGRAQHFDEGAVEPREPLDRVKVFEAQAVGQGERSRHGESCCDRAGERHLRRLRLLSAPGTAACPARLSTDRRRAGDPACA